MSRSIVHVRSGILTTSPVTIYTGPDNTPVLLVGFTLSNTSSADLTTFIEVSVTIRGTNFVLQQQVPAQDSLVWYPSGGEEFYITPGDDIAVSAETAAFGTYFFNFKALD